MKKLLKIVIGIVVLFVAAVAMMFYLTADMSDAADEFFLSIKAGDYDKAYTFLSADFQAGLSRAEFARYLEESALNDYQESSWTAMKREMGGSGELDGAITTTTGGVVPLKLGFIFENKQWKNV